MAIVFAPVSGCGVSAAAMQADLALSILHLFKATFVPNPSNVLADYTAAEADYDTYAPITITAWDNPILAPGSGYMILSGLQQFEVGAADPVVGNVIGGCYLVDAAGKIRQTVIFDAPVPMQFAGQGIPITLTILFPTGV
jgi:hypothetical protein